MLTSSLVAMQPMQWFRTAQESMETEEELIKATEHAQQKIQKMHQETSQARAQEATTQLEKKVNNGTFFSYYRHGHANYAPWLYNEIKKLLDAGADPNIRIKTGSVLESRPPQFPTVSLLEIAIPVYPKIVELLLHYGAQPLGLHKALKEGAANIVKMLIANGADPNASLEDTTWIRLEGERGTLRGDFNRDILPLIYTIELKKTDMFRLLLELGADPYLQGPKTNFSKQWGGPSAYEILIDKINKAQDTQEKTIFEAMLKSIDQYSKSGKIKLP